MAGKISERSGRLLPFATIAVGVALALRRIDDFDTWWHLASGRWIVDNRTIPTTDTLSFTVPDHPWINLQWLYDVMLYGLYSLGGADLLVIASAAAFGTAVWMLMKNLRLWLDEVSASVLCLWAILIAEERFFIRPEMVSFILLQAVLWVLMTARRNQGRRLWLLVPLMLLWVNCHSLFIVGLFCIACAVAGAMVATLPVLPEGWRRGSSLGPAATRRLLMSAGAACVATLINPYFVEGLLFPLNLMSRFDIANAAFQTIGEFRRPFSDFLPTFSISAYQVLFAGSIAVVCAGAVAGRGISRKAGSSPGVGVPGFDLAWLAIFVGLAYLSLLARRNMALFAMGAMPILAATLALIGSRMKEGMGDRCRSAGTVAAPCLLAGSVVLIAAVTTNTYYRWDGTIREFGLGILEANFPIRAAAFAREAELPPRLYNDLTAGGYLAWDAPVDGGVFVDGRLEVYDTRFFTSYVRALSNPLAWKDQIEKYGINTVFLFHRWSNRQELIRFLLRDPEWTLVYRDEVAVLFVRTRCNEGSIAKAREIGPRWQDTISTALHRPTSRWQWPVGRVTALSSYAELLLLIGERESAIEVFEQLLEFKLPPHTERLAHIQVGLYLAETGVWDKALEHLERAAVLDPADRRLNQLIREVRDRRPRP